jgi:acetoin utilization deacetylase AcuC-like enzyme
VSERLVMVTQRQVAHDRAPWILDRRGRRMPGRDDAQRARAVEAGLAAHRHVREVAPETSDGEIAAVLLKLHEQSYLDALRGVDWPEPRLTQEWAPPGLPADSPVWSGAVAAALEGARTAIGAATGTLTGERFVYAVSRPPGHHAGPSWMGGYCYLNTAGAAAQTLLDGGLGPVAIVDLDYHFPTGTAAVAQRMCDVELYSLHASTAHNVPWRPVVAREREHFVDFAAAPSTSAYLAALRDCLTELRRQARAIVLSLGYDTVRGDPHGSWSFPIDVFADIGRLLASAGLPVCVVQEGGYAQSALAGCSLAFARGLLDGGRV